MFKCGRLIGMIQGALASKFFEFLKRDSGLLHLKEPLVPARPRQRNQNKSPDRKAICIQTDMELARYVQGSLVQLRLSLALHGMA